MKFCFPSISCKHWPGDETYRHGIATWWAYKSDNRGKLLANGCVEIIVFSVCLYYTTNQPQLRFTMNSSQSITTGIYSSIYTRKLYYHTLFKSDYSKIGPLRLVHLVLGNVFMHHCTFPHTECQYIKNDKLMICFFTVNCLCRIKTTKHRKQLKSSLF